MDVLSFAWRELSHVSAERLASGRGLELIFRALSERLSATLPYDSLAQLRAKLFAEHPTFGQIDYAPGAAGAAVDFAALGAKGDLAEAPFESPVKAFHLTNPIARASVTMAECAAVVSGAAKIAAE